MIDVIGILDFPPHGISEFLIARCPRTVQPVLRFVLKYSKSKAFHMVLKGGDSSIDCERLLRIASIVNDLVELELSSW